MASTTTTQSSTCRIIKAPHPPAIVGKAVFLAGSIEMGKAVDWQAALTNKLSHLPITVLNPRREDWGGDWVQDMANEKFREQVQWELDCQDTADIIAMFFHPDTKAPISLLELGLYAASKKMVVCCPPGFYRRGNVQMVCHKFDIELVDTLDQLAEGVIRKLAV
ncbi:uncharacterized protein K452DRAFT_300617 [Aplosporella prunicola CBS 121167]|uniref:Uncharacterized protein n=1 Tax=Aplosporella prunicola CBS 121167 TaxID=1176127 RepID=A0A6A6B6J4_9PEZI|nr:uncharacterized protein K452DRAFT_300617 [Aplosporella prunicola CBS 121167]KAF2139043.1 hypothetical protein K452DRAFT_300617 [Aplosporella prunicola CBS 121167]